MGAEESIRKTEVIRLFPARSAVRRSAVAHENPRRGPRSSHDPLVDLDGSPDDLWPGVLHAAGKRVAYHGRRSEDVEPVDHIVRFMYRNAMSGLEVTYLLPGSDGNRRARTGRVRAASGDDPGLADAL